MSFATFVALNGELVNMITSTKCTTRRMMNKRKTEIVKMDQGIMVMKK